MGGRGDREPQWHPGPPETYVVHWDGAAWSRVTTPSPGTDENILLRVTTVTPGDVVASAPEGLDEGKTCGKDPS